MNVRDFLDVRVICETGSLRKAATVLGVSQPTLSNRIAHLEDQLGASLFDRSRGQSKPTDLALFIARRATVMAEEAARLMEETSRLSSGKGGLVRIGIGSGLRVILRDVVTGIARRHPKMSLDLVTAPMYWLVERLLQRQFDLVVCAPMDDEHPMVESELLIETPIVALAHPEHPMCVRPPGDVAGLFKYPIALPVTERHYFDVIRREFGVDIDDLPGRILCSDPGMLALIVTDSRRFFTAGPTFFFKPEVEAGQLAIIRTRIPLRHQIYMHWNRDAYPLPAMDRVRRTVREVTAAARSKYGKAPF